MSVPVPPRNVPALLLRLLAEEFTGAVEVSGAPAGTIHLRRGLVVAVDTPNAPSVETLLIRSGRVDEDGWADAVSRRAAAAAESQDVEGAQGLGGAGGGGELNAVLVELGLVGRGELEAVCIAAVYDAAFAMALNPAEGWTVHEGSAPPELAAWPGESPRELAEETARRIAALTRSWGSLAELAVARCRPATRVEPGLLTARQHAVLLAANGRRTPRDIAFFLGCGVFPAMLDITRLRARHLVEWEAPRAVAALPITARRAAPVEARSDDRGDKDDRTELPRRVPRNPSGSGTTLRRANL
jgi:hypothetical protein